MSTAKHKSFRKVLSVTKQMVDYGTLTVPVTTVVWCLVNEVKTRTLKTDHVAVSVYLGGHAHRGTAMLSHSNVTINLKNPMGSKLFTETEQSSRFVDKRQNEAMQDALRSYILATPALSKGLSGNVSWFNEQNGNGAIELNGELFMFYSCNAIGRKTWFPETACVNFEKGQTVTFDLADMGTHLTPTNIQGGTVDEERWSKLDQSKLAFKCNDKGEATNGLF